MLWILALGYQGRGEEFESARSVSESITNANGKSDKNPFFSDHFEYSSNNDGYLLMCSKSCQKQEVKRSMVS